MSTIVISPPAALPVTLAQVKQHLRIDHDNEDSVLTDLIASATAHVEAHISRALINRNIRQFLDDFQNGLLICLEVWPVRELLVVTRYDASGALFAVDQQYYTFYGVSDPAVVEFLPSISGLDVSNGIEIDFVAGHGEAGVDVPANIIHAILVLVSHWYEFRGAASAADQFMNIPSGWEKLLAPVKRVRI